VIILVNYRREWFTRRHDFAQVKVFLYNQASTKLHKQRQEARGFGMCVSFESSLPVRVQAKFLTKSTTSNSTKTCYGYRIYLFNQKGLEREREALINLMK
jgi:hypothetical protein